MKNIVFLLLLFLPLFTSAAELNDVIISEIAWMGGKDSANNEWLELKNNTGQNILLDGWILKSADEKFKINLTGIILPKGFYLLERTDDNSILGIQADLTYRGTLSNQGMNLQLFDDSNKLIDRADFAGGWLNGNNATKQTMERTDFWGWQTSEGAYGTAKSKNSFGQKSILIKNDPAVLENYPSGIFINELMPAPDGPDETDEWIELYNASNFEIDLSGWKIRDEKGKTVVHQFIKNTKMAGGEYLVLKRTETKITLNNDQDSVSLVFPNDKIADNVDYKQAPTNQSYSKSSSGWNWSQAATPGLANSLPREISNADPSSQATASLKDSFTRLPESKNPWLLFLVALSITIISAVFILILKLKILKK